MECKIIKTKGSSYVTGNGVETQKYRVRVSDDTQRELARTLAETQFINVSLPTDVGANDNDVFDVDLDEWGVNVEIYKFTKTTRKKLDLSAIDAPSTED